MHRTGYTGRISYIVTRSFYAVRPLQRLGGDLFKYKYSKFFQNLLSFLTRTVDLILNSCFNIIAYSKQILKLRSISYIFIVRVSLTKTTAAQNEVALSYHIVHGLCFLAVVFSATMIVITVHI